VLGDLAAIDGVLGQRRVDQVYIALPLEAHRKMLRVLQSVARECVEVRMVPDILQYATLKAIGYTDRSVVSVVIEEALGLSVLLCALGVVALGVYPKPLVTAALRVASGLF